MTATTVITANSRRNESQCAGVPKTAYRAAPAPIAHACQRSGRHDTAINWLRVEQLRGYGGIRIEDDLAVTAQGHENLTRAAFSG